LAVSILPFIAIWFALDPVLGHFKYQRAWGKFILSILLAWCLTFLAGEIFLGIYKLVRYRIWALLPGLIFPFILGFLSVFAWRIVFKGTYLLATQARWPFVRKVVRLGLSGLALVLIGVIFLRWFFIAKYSDRIYSNASVPSRTTVIVFGAGVYAGGPSFILKERMNVAAALFQAGKVERVLLSGDGRAVSFDETTVMETLAQESGIPRSVIVIDPVGYDTYSTCSHAHREYGITQAILVTQAFHLTRALLTCNQLGIDSVGVAAGQRNHDIKSVVVWNLREIPATFADWWKVGFPRPGWE
jgi:vancomycin permeability regulator SanA